MICLVYCIFVVCANRLICGVQHIKADIAKRGRAAVILEPKRESAPVHYLPVYGDKHTVFVACVKCLHNVNTK